MELLRTEWIAVFLLVLTAGLAVAAKRLHQPYPIVLVLGGLILSLVPRLPVISLSPDLVFLVILPPLLFSAAFHTSWREFRLHITSIVLLAFGLVGFTLLGVALSTPYLVPGFDWKTGLVLGAVVATTDAIAATATAKRLGLPRRIVDLLEAESLVNDGSGLLALKFTVAIVFTGRMPTFVSGVQQLAYLVVAGVAIGLALGVAFRWVQAQISDAPIEIAISVVTPYVTYLAAEAAHCSGVLATIACGVYLGRRSSHFYSLHARIESAAFWNSVDFMLNGIVFLLLGLQLPLIMQQIKGRGWGALLWTALWVCVMVIMLRMLWVFPGAWLSRKLNHLIFKRPEEPISRRSVFLVGWAGMRGVLALAAALSLPETIVGGHPFPHRAMIQFLTFALICVTLIAQGLTMPAVIRLLGLSDTGASRNELVEARRGMTQAALLAIADFRKRGEYEGEALDAMEHFYLRQLSMAETERSSHQNAQAVLQIAQRLRAVERDVALRMRDEDRIHDEVLRKLERELDLLEARFTDED